MYHLHTSQLLREILITRFCVKIVKIPLLWFHAKNKNKTKTVAKKDEIDFTPDKCTGTFQALGESAAFRTETQVRQVK